MSNPAKGETVPSLIRQLLRSQDAISSGDVADASGLSRQAAHYHLKRLSEAGELAPVGEGRGRKYRRRFSHDEELEIKDLSEDQVWSRLQREVPELTELNENARRISNFAFTEMLNNAIDHSGSEMVRVRVASTPPRMVFEIEDDGIGAFQHVMKTRALEDHVAAIQEISKGKTTTDPKRHTGQGIFFTSKAVDMFEIASDGWRWLVDNRRDDFAIGRVPSRGGTLVRFQIDAQTDRSLKAVFDEFTDPETFAFSKTRTIVRMFELDAPFVSRSEAKRLARNLEQFEEVVVDFKGVDEVGQAFADELFRVWQNEHHETRLVPLNMNEAVKGMVLRASAENGLPRTTE